MARTASTAFVGPVCLLLGGIGGALASNFVFGGSTGPPEAPGGAALAADKALEAPPDGALVPASAAPAAAAALPAVEDVAESTARRPVGLEGEGPEEGEPQPTAEELGAADSLVAELTTLLRSGRVEQSLAPEPARVIDRLIDLYLEVDDPAAALALLERSETRPGNWYFVADALRDAGLVSEANEALAEAIRIGLNGDGSSVGVPMDVWQIFQRYQTDPDEWLDELRQHAPDLAADLLQQQASAGELTASMRLDLVQSLTQAGRTDAALAEIESMLANGEDSVGVLRALRELDPERAEAELERMMAAGPSTEIELEYFRLLASSDRLDEAMAMIAEHSADGVPPAHLLREAMRTADPDLIRESVDLWAASAPGNTDVQIEVAQFYARSEDYESAANAYLNIYDLAAGGNGDRVPLIPDAVAQAAPGAFRSRLDRMTTFAGSDDEYWGDIADAYWRIGAHQAAEDCWRRASDIDPGDSEWTNKISALENGNQPL